MQEKRKLTKAKLKNKFKYVHKDFFIKNNELAHSLFHHIKSQYEYN